MYILIVNDWHGKQLNVNIFLRCKLVFKIDLRFFEKEQFFFYIFARFSFNLSQRIAFRFQSLEVTYSVVWSIIMAFQTRTDIDIFIYIYICNTSSWVNRKKKKERVRMREGERDNLTAPQFHANYRDCMTSKGAHILYICSISFPLSYFIAKQRRSERFFPLSSLSYCRLNKIVIVIQHDVLNDCKFKA